MSFTYRIGTEEDIPAIVKLLEQAGLHWPGELGTPYVAEDADHVVRGVFFKTLCFHAEPFCAEPGSGVSATEFGKLIAADFQALSNERGVPVTVYASVQDNERALEAARKNGMRAVPGLVLHEITFRPEPGG